MSLVYHILDKIPGVHQEEMQIEYETLAKDLLSSGRMRVDTDYYCNFSRFTDPSSGITLMMTKEELTNPKLLELTRKTIKNLYLQKKQKPDKRPNYENNNGTAESDKKITTSGF